MACRIFHVGDSRFRQPASVVKVLWFNSTGTLPSSPGTIQPAQSTQNYCDNGIHLCLSSQAMRKPLPQYFDHLQPPVQCTVVVKQMRRRLRREMRWWLDACTISGNSDASPVGVKAGSP